MRFIGWFMLYLGWILVTGCERPEAGEWSRRVDIANQKRDPKQLQSFLLHPSSVVRTRAIYHLSRRTSKQAFIALQTFLKRSSPIWRREVLVALLDSKRQDQYANKLLIRFCLESDIELKMATLTELGHHTSVTPALWRCMVQSLEHSSPLLARVAHISLRQQSWHSLQELGRQLNQEKTTEILRKAIIQLLKEITGIQWDQEKSWKQWFQQGRAKLFALRFIGQWPQHKKRLERFLNHKHPGVRKEAARILSRITTFKIGSQLLLHSRYPSNDAFASLWGPKAAQMMLVQLKKRKITLTTQHIRSLGSMLTPAQYRWLLDVGKGKQVASSQQRQKRLAMLQVLGQSARFHGPFETSVIKKLRPLLRHSNPSIVQAAAQTLWYGGYWEKNLDQKIWQAFKRAKHPSERRWSLHALSQFISWTNDRKQKHALMLLLRQPNNAHARINLLHEIAYMGKFTSITPAVTHAFAWATKQPHLFGESTFEILQQLPLSQRYEWFVLFAPQLTPVQWIHLYQNMQKEPSLQGTKVPPSAIARLLQNGLKKGTPSLVLRQATQVIAHFRWNSFRIPLRKLLNTHSQVKKVAIIRAVGKLEDPLAVPLLKRLAQTTKRSSLRWEIALAQLRCGDKQALLWIKNSLAQTKGTAWNVSRELVSQLFKMQQMDLFIQYQKKLRHISSSIALAARLIQTPSQQNLLSLLVRIQHPFEPKEETQWTLRWLTRQHAKSFFLSLRKWAPSLEKEGHLSRLFQFFHTFLSVAAYKHPHGTPVQLLQQLAQDSRLSRASRYMAKLALLSKAPQKLLSAYRVQYKNVLAEKIPSSLQTTWLLPIFKKMKMCQQIQKHLRFLMDRKPFDPIQHKIQLINALLSCSTTNKQGRKQALVWAKKMALIQKNKGGDSLHVLAQAYAQNGLLEDAIQTQFKALHTAKSTTQQIKWSRVLRQFLKAQKAMPSILATKKNVSAKRPASQTTSRPSKQGSPTSRPTKRVEGDK